MRFPKLCRVLRSCASSIFQRDHRLQITMARQTTQKKRALSVPAGKFGRTEIAIAAALAIVTFAIYAQVIGHQFITLDDPTYIQENPMVNRGVTLAGVAWALSTFHATNWHPLTWISHMIDCQLFGTNAGRHLLVTALIHLADTLLA